MSFGLLGIGEVLWDLLPSGPQLGGAPANFAFHARALGAAAGVISRVGRDQNGDRIRERFAAAGFKLGDLQVDDAAPTGTVTVALGAKGIPQYTIHENVAWDRLAVTPAAKLAVGTADAICFGSLGQRTPAARSTIQSLVAASPSRAWRVFDINLRQHYFSRPVIEESLKLANVLKLNDAELPVLAGMFALAGEPAKQSAVLARQFDLQVVALTRGAAGSLLWREGAVADGASAPVEVVDTVGAGDAFTAALVMGLLRNLPLPEINAGANEVARFVCSRAGATPSLPPSLARRYAG